MIPAMGRAESRVQQYQRECERYHFSSPRPYSPGNCRPELRQGELVCIWRGRCGFEKEEGWEELAEGMLLSDCGRIQSREYGVEGECLCGKQLLADRSFGVGNYVPVAFNDINVFIKIPKIIREDFVEAGVVKVVFLPGANHGCRRSCVRFSRAKGF